MISFESMITPSSVMVRYTNKSGLVADVKMRGSTVTLMMLHNPKLALIWKCVEFRKDGKTFDRRYKINKTYKKELLKILEKDLDSMVDSH